MPMHQHPYKSLPAKAFWRRSVVAIPPEAVNPVGIFELRLQRATKVATAGSCFAQHIARYLKISGFNYYVVELGHSILPEQVRNNHNYGMFSARYGNIYTARQLLQLFERAYGRFVPQEDAWVEVDGKVFDPYRPTVQPGGFVSVDEMHADRVQHLAAVRCMFETMDVFVFTLGLTECWRSNVDGAVFPLCPGVKGGNFNPAKHVFYNQDVTDVMADMQAFVRGLQEVNPKAQMVLTVSPVPLMATADPGAHVLSATSYSKSVLRVAAEMLRKEYQHVHYFPSFEIITGNFSRGRYYTDDLRSVREEGVSHVMRMFLYHAAGGVTGQKIEAVAELEDSFITNSEAVIALECDENALDE